MIQTELGDPGRRLTRSGRSGRGFALAARLPLVKRRARPYVRRMNVSGALVPVAVGAVAVVLLLGLVNMLRGGSPSRSQNLMRLRVILQFVAILVILGVMWWRSG